MDRDIRQLYFLLCKPKGPNSNLNGEYLNENICKHRFTVKGSQRFKNMVDIDIYENEYHLKSFVLLPEYLWDEPTVAELVYEIY